MENHRSGNGRKGKADSARKPGCYEDHDRYRDPRWDLVRQIGEAVS
jgi:hypothetical protein